MQSRLTAVLSLSGVLVAGSAAALVNTQVLRHTGGESALSADPLIDVSAGIPVVSLTPTDGSVPEGQLGADGAPVTANAVAYEVGTAGIVVLDSDGSVLSIVSIEPATGWTVVENHQETATHAHVAFQSGSTVVNFEANLLFGVVGTSVEMYTLSSGDGTGGSSAGVGAGGGSSGGSTTSIPSTTIDDSDEPDSTDEVDEVDEVDDDEPDSTDEVDDD
jgi:hypothetical protein